MSTLYDKCISALVSEFEKKISTLTSEMRQDVIDALLKTPKNNVVLYAFDLDELMEVKPPARSAPIAFLVEYELRVLIETENLKAELHHYIEAARTGKSHTKSAEFQTWESEPDVPESLKEALGAIKGEDVWPIWSETFSIEDMTKIKTIQRFEADEYVLDKETAWIAQEFLVDFFNCPPEHFKPLAVCIKDFETLSPVYQKILGEYRSISKA